MSCVWTSSRWQQLTRQEVWSTPDRTIDPPGVSRRSLEREREREGGNWQPDQCWENWQEVSSYWNLYKCFNFNEWIWSHFSDIRRWWLKVGKEKLFIKSSFLFPDLTTFITTRGIGFCGSWDCLLFSNIFTSEKTKQRRIREKKQQLMRQRLTARLKIFVFVRLCISDWQKYYKLIQ